MTDNIINFRKAKKSVTRLKNGNRADQNRAKFGRTKAQKLKDAAVEAKQKKRLDGHKLDETPE